MRRGARPRARVAEVGERPVGDATCELASSTWRAAEYLHVDRLFVVAARRTCGVGSALMDAPARERRFQRFLSQPFFVAEAFTGTPGKYVKL